MALTAAAPSKTEAGQQLRTDASKKKVSPCSRTLTLGLKTSIRNFTLMHCAYAKEGSCSTNACVMRFSPPGAEANCQMDKIFNPLPPSLTFPPSDQTTGKAILPTCGRCLREGNLFDSKPIPSGAVCVGAVCVTNSVAMLSCVLLGYRSIYPWKLYYISHSRDWRRVNALCRVYRP